MSSEQALHRGTVGRGFQIASGASVGAPGNPFPRGALRLQAPLFKAAGLDLEAEIAGLVWGTVSVELAYELSRGAADITLEGIDWTAELTGEGRIGPETFSFFRCHLTYADRSYRGLIYLPHPETKPATNAHRKNVLEVLTSQVEGLTFGQPVSVLCRADAFTASLEPRWTR
ncbi:hypothetical protein JKL49_07620 [Phenylobacterium sp. 20VBR1]|uniref:Uncharacterized protein n=1 Tax=Phenylobacterium glaciei TaxID=2803784 RepID=A0A941D1R5_9CAUL|nr:hypothetical protein [Phenylobacterium glaciei]MBR7619256.1 hypothetical protein [Phenylobacterium glaciei]